MSGNQEQPTQQKLIKRTHHPIKRTHTIPRPYVSCKRFKTLQKGCCSCYYVSMYLLHNKCHFNFPPGHISKIHYPPLTNFEN